MLLPAITAASATLTLGLATVPQAHFGTLAAAATCAASALLIAASRFNSTPTPITTAPDAGTLKRLLDFTNSVQGAGQPKQIFRALGQSLRTELDLAGIVILFHEAGTNHGVSIEDHWPLDLIRADRVSELDHNACPCLRQNLPREFQPACSGVRCGIDDMLRSGTDESTYCIPFSIHRRGQSLVHMLLPPGRAWTYERKKLAHAYVNTAGSSLMSLQLLLDAEQRSLTDPLTQLFNRLSMEQLLQREVALAERHNQPFSLVMMDLDYFKQVNDHFGHAAGDHLLKSLADCIRMTLRKTDLAFRVGGDEFVIALPQTAMEQAQQVVGKLRQAFASVDFTDAIAQLENTPTLSIGIAERCRAANTLTLSALLAGADEALYQAKANNRNCVRVYRPAA